jgi:hypothetical protein
MIIRLQSIDRHSQMGLSMPKLPNPMIDLPEAKIDILFLPKVIRRLNHRLVRWFSIFDKVELLIELSNVVPQLW